MSGWRTVYRKVGSEHVDVEVERLVGKERPRFANGHAYSTAGERRYERAIKSGWLEKVGAAWSDFDGEVRVTLMFFRELPKSAPRHREFAPNLASPDVDNMAKAVMDALNGVAYRDDRQVTSLSASKMPALEHGSGCRVRIQCDYFEYKRIKE